MNKNVIANTSSSSNTADQHPQQTMYTNIDLLKITLSDFKKNYDNVDKILNSDHLSQKLLQTIITYNI